MIESGTFGLKRQINLVSMKPDTTETLYIGDSFISGNHMSKDECYTEDIDIDSFSKRTVDKNYWEIKIKEEDWNVAAYDDAKKVLDSYHLNIHREN